jgi:hypothetical protein
MRGEREPSTSVGMVARTRVSRAAREVGIWFHSLCLESKKRATITLKEEVSKKNRETLGDEIMVEVKNWAPSQVNPILGTPNTSA